MLAHENKTKKCPCGCEGRNKNLSNIWDKNCIYYTSPSGNTMEENWVKKYNDIFHMFCMHPNTNSLLKEKIKNFIRSEKEISRLQERKLVIEEVENFRYAFRHLYVSSGFDIVFDDFIRKLKDK